MWRAEVPRAHSRRAHDLLSSAREIVAHVRWRAAMELPMVIAVIPDLMPIERRAPHELRPSLGVPPEHEERGANTLAAQHFEDARRGPRIRTIVEGEAHDRIVARQVREHGPEHDAVAVPCTVRRDPRSGEARDGGADHRWTAPRASTE